MRFAALSTSYKIITSEPASRTMSRNALITGGNSGIGLELARAARGDRIIIASRDRAHPWTRDSYDPVRSP
jgi:hypothetical protein